ncbi:unnamed protein product [Cylindrotheca closterium]|uniref:Fe2OG dioxygenase domain-containing protein n=1 Tax=Cylindrotheca closterium TaxID=2856 RepID=A0AAD2FE88_9STRA|nr:unnamed protein product [Cylindrotheca closterium]
MKSVSAHSASQSRIRAVTPRTSRGTTISAEEEPMNAWNWAQQIESLLDSNYSEGEVSTSREVQMPGLHPKIIVKGMPEGDSRLSFPLSKSQALALKKSTATKREYFGKKIRNAWPVDANRVQFLDSNREWTTKLKQITMKCVDDLGLQEDQKCDVKANLHKMLLYEAGGGYFYSKHNRGTETEAGTFATMVIQLPSKYTGGCLQICLNGGELKYDRSGAKSDDGFFVTAFFSDCEYELSPVTSGYRLCLVYNLILQDTSWSSDLPFPSAQTVGSTSQALQRLVQRMPTKDSWDPVQGYSLKGKYTKTNLHFYNLKGRDLDTVSLLRDAVDENGNKLFVAYLMLLEKSVDGQRYSSYDNTNWDDESDGEEFRTHISAVHWIGPNDTMLDHFNLPFNINKHLVVDYPDDVFDETPDNKNYENCDGNADPTLEYWKGVVVFWPLAKNPEVMKQAGRSFLESSLEAATIQSDIQAYAKQLVSLFEETRYESPTGKAIRAIARSKDDSLIIRVLDCIKRRIPINDDAVGIIEVLKASSSETLKQSFFTMLRRVSKFEPPPKQPSKQSSKKSSKEPSKHSLKRKRLNMLLKLQHPNVVAELKHLSAVLRLLESSGLNDFVVPAKEAIFASFIEHLDSIVRASSRKYIGQLTEPFIDEPAIFKRIVNIVVTIPTFVGPTLKHVMTLVPDASANKYVVQLAKVRAQELLSETRDGAPIFTWCQPQSPRWTMSQSQAVDTFLQGPNEIQSFTGFSDIGSARNWAADFSRLSGFDARKLGLPHFHVSATASGSGSDSQVVVTKTKGYWDGVKKAYDEKVAELKKLQSVFGTSFAPKRRAATTQGGTKKQKSSRRGRRGSESASRRK